MLASCSEELFDEAIESSNKRAIKEVKFNELYKDSKFKNLLEKISHNSNAARTSFENQNGFTISDGFVKVIETDSVISYTMLIERDVVTDTISFENLVIQENKFSASEKAYSIKYTPTIIKPSGHDSFYYEGTEVLKNLAFTGFNRVGENAIETSNCYVNVVQVWCSQPNPGEANHHLARKGCLASTQYYKVVSILSSDCEGDGSSSGSSGSNNTNAPQGPTGPGNSGGITSPVKPTPIPCPGDPVKNPKICPSSPGNIKGGTYGCTRYDSQKQCNFTPGLKKHAGVDVLLPPTSLVYAMHAGVVVGKYDDLQPSEYVERSLGNWVEIQSVINSETIRIKYCHLATIEVGSTSNIQQGQVIAFSGKNGNAGSKGVTAHLHIQAKKLVGNSWVEINPIDLFDKIFDQNTLQPIGSKSNCK